VHHLVGATRRARPDGMDGLDEEDAGDG